ncbi:MAG: hypothetical protein QXY08_07535 [Nitrososphaerales archaeon]
MPTVGYELAPPKIIGVSRLELEAALSSLYSKVESLKAVVDRILITSSVIGIPRLPSVFTAALVKKSMPGVWVGCSIRTCDYLLHQSFKAASEAFIAGLNGVLLVYGDKPIHGSSFKNYPSNLLKIIRQFIPSKNLPKIYLSAKAQKDKQNIERKLEAKPDGFITQIVTEVEQILWLRDICRANKLELSATILTPSPKNLTSAAKIGLNWQPDEDDATQLVQNLLKEDVSISLTSPWSFREGLEFAKKIKSLCK